MKKLLIICILIVSLVFISGCTDEEKINLEADDGESSIVSQINPKSDINTEQKENSLQDLEHFIDPKLSKVRIESPDIEVVRFELIDKREIEDDQNYGVRILVSNDGDTPVWMDSPYLLYHNGFKSAYHKTVSKELILLESGERKWFTLSPKSLRHYEYYLKYLRTLSINSHRTVTPDISPELKNLHLNSIKVYFSGIGRSYFPTFDINSIKYEEEGEWKYIILGITSFGQGMGVKSFELGSDPSWDGTISKNFYGEQIGQIQYIKIPVPKSSTIESVNAISLHI